MESTLQERKAKAVEFMGRLGIFEGYIEAFEKNNRVCYFEDCIGFYDYQNDSLFKKRKQFESFNNCAVYAITHEMTDIGEMYSFLFVPEDKDEWDYCIEEYGGTYYIQAYVWNKEYNLLSEYGSIGIKSQNGGIRRVS